MEAAEVDTSLYYRRFELVSFDVSGIDETPAFSHL